MAESELNPSTAPWVIATRESRLAMWQAEHVQRLLQALTPRPVELLGMTTRGDQILDRSLSKVGGKGLFVKELEVALEQGRAHLAVHSLKDLPMTLPEGYALATVLAREDPRDALVSHHHDSIDALPAGAVVGTSSLRRAAQLRAWRPDVRVEPLRGNLDTRLRKLDEGQFDAIVLAAAGLLRLGLASRIRACVDPARMVPAAGQGALGIEVLAGADELAACLDRLTDGPTWLAVHAEREVSRVMGGSCSVPLAAHAHWDGSRLLLDAAIGDAEPGDRAVLLRCAVAADVVDVASAQDLGRQAAQALFEQGAQGVLDRLASSSSA